MCCEGCQAEQRLAPDAGEGGFLAAAGGGDPGAGEAQRWASFAPGEIDHEV